MLRGKKKPALEQTRGFIGRDSDALYIAFECRDSSPGKIQGQALPQDSMQIFDCDEVEVFISPYNGDKYYRFVLNPMAAKFDSLGYDKQWDALWSGKAVRNNNGWSAEFKIPFACLELDRKTGDKWKLNLCRHRANRSNKEFSSWSPVCKNFHDLTQFGILRFLPAEKFEIFNLTAEPKLYDNAIEVKIHSERIDPFPAQITVSVLNGPKVVKHFQKTLSISGGSEQYVLFEGLSPLKSTDSGKVQVKVKDNRSGQIVNERIITAPACVSKPAAPVYSFLDKSFYTNEAVANLLVKYDSGRKPFPKDRLSLSLMQNGRAVGEVKHSRKLSRIADSIPIKINNLTPGTYQLVVNTDITMPNGKPANIKNIIELVKAPPETNVLKIDREQQVFIKADRPFIPLVAVPEYLHVTKQMFADMSSHGFNTILQTVGRSEKELLRIQNLLDEAQRNNFKVILWPGVVPKETYQELHTGITGIIKRFKSHRALLAWYLVDEPEGWWEQQGLGKTTDLIALYKAAKQIDPYHPVFVNHFTKWKQGKGLYEGKDNSDIYSADNYTIGYGGYGEEGGHASMLGIADYVSAMNYDGMRDGKLVSMTIEFADPCFDQPPYFPRSITPEEERCMVYLSLVHGARQIMFYDRKPLSVYLWDSMTQLGQEVQEMTPFLSGNDNSGLVSVNSKFIHFTVKTVNNKHYLVAVNSSEKALPITFSLAQGSFAENAFADVLFESRKAAWEKYQLNDWFAPYERHVYRLK
ncbi:MAG: hypothetical protein PHV82_12095 [Victivallaceae bacterium]|nr:hypothetical protein [Victivallaceae bacterium]